MIVLASAFLLTPDARAEWFQAAVWDHTDNVYVVSFEDTAGASGSPFYSAPWGPTGAIQIGRTVSGSVKTACARFRQTSSSPWTMTCHVITAGNVVSHNFSATGMMVGLMTGTSGNIPPDPGTSGISYQSRSMTSCPAGYEEFCFPEDGGQMLEAELVCRFENGEPVCEVVSVEPLPEICTCIPEDQEEPTLPGECDEETDESAEPDECDLRDLG